MKRKISKKITGKGSKIPINSITTTSGITLIALVITIIVLLILAGVSIAMLTSENGILTNAFNAKAKNNESQIEEELRLAYGSSKVEQYMNSWDINKKAQELQKELQKSDNSATVTVNGTNFNISYKGYKKTMSEHGILQNTNVQPKIYTISIESAGFPVVSTNNPSTISEGETVTLNFSLYSTASFAGVYVTGAEYKILSQTDTNMKLEISNPSTDVLISFNIAECCFVPGTQVLMADGNTKNIEDVVVGDLVMSYNEENNNYEIDKVINLITNPNTTDLAQLNLIDGTNIEMNAYHPVYTQDGWKSLTQHEGLPLLTENDKILSTNGSFISISSIDRWTENEPITTYNLGIKKNHNFFVGITPLLVHNASCPT